MQWQAVDKTWLPHLPGILFRGRYELDSVHVWPHYKIIVSGLPIFPPSLQNIGQFRLPDAWCPHNTLLYCVIFTISALPLSALQLCKPRCSDVFYCASTVLLFIFHHSEKWEKQKIGFQTSLEPSQKSLGIHKSNTDPLIRCVWKITFSVGQPSFPG